MRGILFVKIKRVLHKIYDFSESFIFPKKIFSIILSLSHYFIFSRVPKNSSYGVSKKILNFKKNEDCILIANGPSTGDFDLSLIPECFDVVTINQFYKSQYSKQIKSNFHICAEPFDGNLPLKIYKHALEDNLLHNSMCYVLHPAAKKILHNHKYNKRIYQLNNSLIKLANFEFGCLDLELRMPLFNCTGSASLAICIALSYKNIYVIGMDQTQLSSKIHFNKHFYDSKDEVPIGPMVAKHKNFLERLLKKTRTIEGLFNLTNIAERNNIKIYNVSSDKSMIDFWEGINYETLCNIKKK